MDTSEGHLLGGRVRYAQPPQGFRSGIEPVLLAAALPARSHERVLEVGCGAGATLLCLAARVPGITGLGVEIESGLAELAERNATANGWAELRFIAADIAKVGAIGTFDHACANPPYHPATGSMSPDGSRELAKRGRLGLLADWAGAMGVRLRHRGTLTMILPAAELAAAFDALTAADCRPAAILPLWPRTACPAKLTLVRGVKGGRGPLRLSAGVVLHCPDGGFTPEADAVLRDAAALRF